MRAGPLLLPGHPPAPLAEAPGPSLSTCGSPTTPRALKGPSSSPPTALQVEALAPQPCIPPTRARALSSLSLLGETPGIPSSEHRGGRAHLPRALP